MARFNTVDCDAHYNESMPELAEYLDEPWRTRWEDNPDRTGTDSTAYRVGKIQPGASGDRFLNGRISRAETGYPTEAMTPEKIPEIMDHIGIDKCVLLSQKMLGFGLIKNDEKAVQMANGYADYMLDQVVDPDEDIYSVITVPYHAPDASVELVDRVADERGIVGAVFVTPEADPVLGHRRYEPIYEACEDAGLPVIFHAGSIGEDNHFFSGFSSFLQSHTVGFLTNNVVHAVSVVTEGIPEKFPDLDIIFQECGLFWIPMLMQRLDVEYMKRQSEAPLLTKRPSKYMQGFYYGTQPLEIPDNERYLEQVIEMIGGAEQIMYASDYPHWDYDMPSVITDREFLSDREKARILGGTAEEVFGI